MMKITILGAGRSGIAAAILARKLGHAVFVSEMKDTNPNSIGIRELKQLLIDHETGKHSNSIFDAELVIASPGIPPSAVVIKQLEEKGIPVISELEWAWRHTTNKVISVTGTNGKTTTTTLVAQILNSAGINAVACGNIGTPLSACLMEHTRDTVFVVETSSYQLDRCDTFSPAVSIILNISPDHTSYHGSLENYVSAKWKTFLWQGAGCVVILNKDDKVVAASASLVPAQVQQLTFSFASESSNAYTRNGNIYVRLPQHEEELLMPVKRLGIPGPHNVYNSLAATLAARVFEIRNENIRDSLMGFDGVEHRLELVTTVNNIRIVNDSKATNINAAWYALSSFDAPIVWIAGGRADNNDYSVLDDLVQTNVSAIICLGEQSDTIFQRWCTTKRCVQSHDLHDAVSQAMAAAESGGVVLFSPACKSFDMFNSFEERGRLFKESVRNFTEK